MKFLTQFHTKGFWIKITAYKLFTFTLLIFLSFDLYRKETVEISKCYSNFSHLGLCPGVPFCLQSIAQVVARLTNHFADDKKSL